MKLAAPISHKAHGADTIANYLIEKAGGKLQLKGSPVSFDSLDGLVAYFAQAARYPLSVKLSGGGGGGGVPEAMYGELGGMGGLGLDVSSGLDYLYDDTFNFDGAVPPGEEVYGGFGGADAPISPQSMRTTADAVSPEQVEALQREAELVAARRKAAELNVRLLLEHEAAAGHDGRGADGEDQASRASIEAETRQRMAEQMSEMQNKSLLAGWVAQMEEIDKLRGADPSQWPPASQSGNSESRARVLYEEIGQYNGRLEQLKGEERTLADAEAAFHASQAVMRDMRDLIFGIADRVVQEHEWESNMEELDQLRVFAKQQEVVADALRPLAALFGGSVGTMLHNSAAYAQSTALASQGKETQWWKFGKKSSKKDAELVQQGASMVQQLAAGTASAGLFAPPPPSAAPAAPRAKRLSFTSDPAPAAPYSSRGAVSPRGSMRTDGGGSAGAVAPPPADGKPAWMAMASERKRWERKPAPPPVADAPAPFEIVKFKRPAEKPAAGGPGAATEIPCSFLGNCQCPKCVGGR